MSDDRTPEMGSLVYTSDGHELGRIKELDSTCFKVDTQAAPDWWLPIDSIAHEQSGTLLLRSTLEELGQPRPELEDHRGFHLHS